MTTPTSLLLAPASLTLAALLPLSDWFVDQNDPSCSTGNGSPASPFCDIQDALAVAVGGDRIFIAPGTYTENLSITNDLQIYGMEGQAVTIVDGGASGSVIVVEQNATVLIDGLTLRNGRAAEGGGLYARGTVTLRNSTISGNEATGTYAGGGIGNDYGSGPLVLENCTVTGNIATHQFGGNGAGISAVYGDSLRLTNCTVSGNTIASAFGGYGGGIFTYKTPLYITASTISGNDSGYIGGGIMAYKSNPTELRNTTISGNSGGGLLTYGGQPYPTLLSNVTIADNTGAGGFEHDLSVPAQVRNTIIAGNSGAYGSQDVHGTFNSLGHNLIGVVSSAIGFTNGVNGDIVGTAGNPVSAGLLPLANNGGPTQTRALMATSLAIDAGDPVVFEPTDQRGVPRTPGASDIGSYEASIGMSIPGCNANANSTGLVGRATAAGSQVVALNNFSLAAESLPTHTFGYFIASRTQSIVANPGGSQGVLCLGGAIIRFVGPGQIQNSGATGSFSIPVNLAVLAGPFPPGLPGQTWSFQGWHRDSLGGFATSNFTTGVAVLFL
jgi:hypothetical protein